MKMLDIKHNLLQIQDEITRTAQENGRNPEEICLLAVSKTKPIDLILSAYQAGQKEFAENYVQEAVEKVQLLKSQHPHIWADIRWHYIGQIQSNKCTEIAKHFSWVHSLSSLKHAKRLNRLRENIEAPLNICIQVKLDEQKNRNGIQLSETQELMQHFSNLNKLKLRGLMCVLPTSYSGKKAFEGFLLVQDYFKILQESYPSLDTLSLGMSGDFKEAIQAGSTLLRLGSSIFGERP